MRLRKQKEGKAEEEEGDPGEEGKQRRKKENQKWGGEGKGCLGL